MTLSTEIAAARPEEQREVLERLWECIHGKAPKWHEWYGDARISHDARYFRRMLDCGAFLSAAETLAPDDVAWSIVHEREKELSNYRQPFFAEIRKPFWTSYGEVWSAWGATPALALAAAIAKSLEGREDR